jgi:hypothetical protein
MSWRRYLGDLSGLRSGRVTNRFRPGHSRFEPPPPPPRGGAPKAPGKETPAGAAAPPAPPKALAKKGAGAPTPLPLPPPPGKALERRGAPRSTVPARAPASLPSAPRSAPRPRSRLGARPGGLLSGLFDAGELGDDVDQAPNGAVWVSGTTGQLYASTDAAALPLVYPDGTPALAQLFLPALALDVDPIRDKPLRASPRDFSSRDYDKSINPGGNRGWNPDLGAYGWVNDGGWHYVIDQACDAGGMTQPIDRTFPGLDLSRAIAVQDITGRCKDVRNSFQGVTLKRYIFKADFDWTNTAPNAAAYIWLYLNFPEFASTSWVYQPADLWRYDTRPPETAGSPTKLPAAAWLDLNFLDAVYTKAHGLDLLSNAGLIDPVKYAKFTASYPQTWALALDSLPGSILATVYERGQKTGYVHEQPDQPQPQPQPKGDAGDAPIDNVLDFFRGGRGGRGGAPADDGTPPPLPPPPPGAEPLPMDEVPQGTIPGASDQDLRQLIEQLLAERQAAAAAAPYPTADPNVPQGYTLEELEAQFGTPTPVEAAEAPTEEEAEPWVTDEAGNVYLLADDGQYYPSEMFGEDAWADLSGERR